MENIKPYKPYIIFSSIIIFGLLVFFSISEGYYPIASVDGDFISANSFWEKYNADFVYYQNFIKTYGETIEGVKIDTPKSEDLKRKVLTSLIENIIIEKGARIELGDDLDILVKNKIDKASEDETFKKAVSGVYGASFSDFTDDFLIPLAKEEILSGRLFLKGENFEEWLKGAKKESQVKIFSSEYFWDGQEIQMKSN